MLSIGSLKVYARVTIVLGVISFCYSEALVMFDEWLSYKLHEIFMLFEFFMNFFLIHSNSLVIHLSSVVKYSIFKLKVNQPFLKEKKIQKRFI
jgi:hypothetical protein